MIENIKNKIPVALIYSRLTIVILIIVLSALKIKFYNTVAIGFLSFGLLTDIFDGIIARQLKISTQRLRRLDSTIDQIFFLSFAVATYIQCPLFFEKNSFKLIVLITAEALAYLLCFIKFKKEIATHTIGAKVWTLFLFATLIEVILHCRSVLLFNFCFWIGIITRLEIMFIILTLKKWANDVPTFYHSLKLRQGKEIKQHKLFNG